MVKLGRRRCSLFNEDLVGHETMLSIGELVDKGRLELAADLLDTVDMQVNLDRDGVLLESLAVHDSFGAAHFFSDAVVQGNKIDLGASLSEMDSTAWRLMLANTVVNQHILPRKCLRFSQRIPRGATKLCSREFGEMGGATGGDLVWELSWQPCLWWFWLQLVDE